MSKKVEVAGQIYDSRTVINETERLHLPNHPKVNAIAIPQKVEAKHTGKLKVIVKIPFGKLEANAKEIILTIPSPRRIDAINKVVEAVKSCPMYRRA
jgi:hypothetical protein